MMEFLRNIKQELDKITWPTGKEMKLHSTQVFVFMVILSLFFAGIDAIISAGVAAATGDDVVEEYYDDEYEEDDLNDLLEYDEDEYDVENGDED